MSRGFVKESDQEELPIIPPRADLPARVTNYVTESGYNELLVERDKLISERDNLLISDEDERRIAVNFINAKLQLLAGRISTAKVIDVAKQPKDVVRFGARVSFTTDSDSKIEQYEIVGVDEANIAKGKIAFTSPLARIFMDKRVGDSVTLKLAKTQKHFQIMSIDY